MVSGSRSPPTEEGSSSQPPQDDPSLETLRDILFARYRQQIAQLEADIDDLERRVSDKDTLTAIVTPIIGDAIRRKIRDSRDEMVEILYPIIGQTVVRAVREAIRDLARSIDAQMRTSFSPSAIWWRLRARVSGVSDADVALREALPFEIAEVFLIHRETGLLLWHVSHDPAASPDSDLISGMLTAIRDFVQDAFGWEREGQLDEIQYGERRILIEATQLAYLAVVVDGIEPPGFREEMRERILEITYAHDGTLRQYEGDSAPLATVEGTLRSLVVGAEPPGLSRAQKCVMAGVLVAAVICLVATGLVGWWGWQAATARPVPPATATPTATVTFTPTSTPSPTPTQTPSPTPTPAPTRTPSPTSTPTPTPTPQPTIQPTATFAPVLGAAVGSEWVHEEPVLSSPRGGSVLERGQPVEILAAYGDWYLVRWMNPTSGEVSGWVLSRWVGTVDPIPAWIVTPTTVP
jgi:hypothetical protein